MFDMLTELPDLIGDWVKFAAEKIVSSWDVIRTTAAKLWQTADSWYHKASPYLEKAWHHAHEWTGYAEWGVAILALIAAIYLVRKHGISGLKHNFLNWLGRIAHLLHGIHVGSPASIVFAIIVIIAAIFGFPHDHDHDHDPPQPPSDVHRLV